MGGIVSEPDGERRAALIVLPGLGRAARSGVNSFWTRTARALAELGIVVLRFDYSREGETLPLGEGGGGQIWKRDLDLRLLRQVAPWFRERAGNTPLMLVGACSGARLVIELAGREPDAVAETFLIVPYLSALAQPGMEGVSEPGELETVDPLVVDCFRTMLERASSWVLVGERDSPDIPALTHQIGQTPHELEVEVVPSVALHLLDQPHLQGEAGSRLMARVSSSLAASAPR